jgi:hypothetical protein
LAHVVMDSNKSQDLQSYSPSWRPHRDDRIISVWRPIGSRPRKSRCFHLSLKAGKKSDVLIQRSWRQKKIPSYLGKGSVFVLFRPSTDWMRTILTGKDHLLYSVYQLNVNLIKNTLTEILRIFHQISAHIVVQKSWYKINHHRCFLVWAAVNILK